MFRVDFIVFLYMNLDCAKENWICLVMLRENFMQAEERHKKQLCGESENKTSKKCSLDASKIDHNAVHF